jgi:hypothetical protein
LDLIILKTKKKLYPPEKKNQRKTKEKRRRDTTDGLGGQPDQGWSALHCGSQLSSFFLLPSPPFSFLFLLHHETFFSLMCRGLMW